MISILSDEVRILNSQLIRYADTSNLAARCWVTLRICA
ncbi:nitric oxide synthase oxygenase [Deinococcus cavernae]|nr:nitric oxide synthase oxygenase [Deinococcus cavernae]